MKNNSRSCASLSAEKLLGEFTYEKCSLKFALKKFQQKTGPVHWDWPKKSVHLRLVIFSTLLQWI